VIRRFIHGNLRDLWIREDRPVTDQTDLFTQMDQAADLMRRENPYGGKADMVLLFRDIQKSVMPELTTEQYQDAFDDWLLHDLARWERRIPRYGTTSTHSRKPTR
jgi:hypothetical protein